MTDHRHLRALLDVTSLINHGQDIGAGRYILNLIKGMLSLDEDIEYILFGTCSDSRYLPLAYGLKQEFPHSHMGFRFFKAGQKMLKTRELLRFPPIELLGLRGDIVHAMDYNIPPTINKNIILTIHDLAFMRFPELNFEWFIKKYSRMVAKNTLLSKKILAPSQSTAHDIHKYFNTEKHKIETVHLAAAPAFRLLPSSEIDCLVPEAFGIKPPFLLSVGTIEPRKDFPTLIGAYNTARQRQPGFIHRLVIAGRTGWKSEETYRTREASPYKDDIIFTGRLTDRELVQMYNQADVFVYTSLFEGFGLPPLEAMSCGLPVICTDSSSLTEVVDDAGILVPPGNTRVFAEKILLVTGSRDLKKKLSQSSLKRAGEFSWKKTAEKTLSVYREAAGLA